MQLLIKRVISCKMLYLFLLPTVVYFVVFHYIPMYGIVISFMDYKFLHGISGSKWVGFDNFAALFNTEYFWQVFKNTIIISGAKYIFGFPAPIIFAIMLNEIRNRKFKKITQTISYLPHFFSWVILSGLVIQFLSPSHGPVNYILSSLGFKTIYFVADPGSFRFVLVITYIWKSIGWGSIIYLATLSNIDIQLYESADIDGAKKRHKIFYITIPSIMPVVVIMMILSVGNLINDDFDQIFNLYNPSVYDVGDVISTYTYRIGLQQMKYSFGTAVGLFKNVIGFSLVMTTNAIARRFSDYAIW